MIRNIFKKQSSEVVPPRKVTLNYLQELLMSKSLQPQWDEEGNVLVRTPNAYFYFYIDTSEHFLTISSVFPLRVHKGPVDMFQRLNAMNNNYALLKVFMHGEDEDNPAIRFVTDMNFAAGLIPDNLMRRFYAFEELIVSDHPVRPLMGVAH